MIELVANSLFVLLAVVVVVVVVVAVVVVVVVVAVEMAGLQCHHRPSACRSGDGDEDE